MVSYTNPRGPEWTVDAATQYGRSQGLLGANEVAQGGLLQQRLAEAGPQAQATHQQFKQAYLNPSAGEGGFVPATIETLNPAEQAALRTQATGQVFDQGAMTQATDYLKNLMNTTQTVNPMATQYLQQGGDILQQSAAPVTMEEIEAFRNPYAQALQDRLTEEGAIARQRIQAQQGMRGGRSFGDISQGRRESYLDAEIGRRRGEIDYNTYQDSLGYLQNLRNQQAQSGSALASLGPAAQGVTSSGANIGRSLASSLFGAGQGLMGAQRTATADQLGAGQYIRSYNQAINDAIASNILGEQNFPIQNISTVQQLLQPFQSGMQNVTYNDPSTLAQVGGGLTAAGGILSTLNQPVSRPSGSFVGPMPTGLGALGSFF